MNPGGLMSWSSFSLDLLTLCEQLLSTGQLLSLYSYPLTQLPGMCSELNSFLLTC